MVRFGKEDAYLFGLPVPGHHFPSQGLSGDFIQQVIRITHGILKAFQPQFDRFTVVLLHLRIQKHSFDNRNCLPKFGNLVVDTLDERG